MGRFSWPETETPKIRGWLNVSVLSALFAACGPDIRISRQCRLDIASSRNHA
jgi:hypothetical protein